MYTEAHGLYSLDGVVIALTDCILYTVLPCILYVLDMVLNSLYGPVNDLRRRPGKYGDPEIQLLTADIIR